jgi:hypothetical protein
VTRLLTIRHRRKERGIATDPPSYGSETFRVDHDFVHRLNLSSQSDSRVHVRRFGLPL